VANNILNKMLSKIFTVARSSGSLQRNAFTLSR